MVQILASGPYQYQGILRAVEAFAPRVPVRDSAEEKKYVVIQDGVFTTGERKKSTSTKLTYVASNVINALSWDITKGVDLQKVAEGLDVLAKGSEEKAAGQCFLCRWVTSIRQIWTNGVVFDCVSFIGQDQSSRYIVRQLASHLRKVNERMKRSNDQNFVLFMTVLTGQHNAVRRICTAGRSQFNYLVEDHHVSDVRENLKFDNSTEILEGIKTLDLSEWKGELTKETLTIIGRMTNLDDLKLPTSVKGTLTLTNENLETVEVTGSKLTKLDVSQAPKLATLNVSSNKNLKSVVVHSDAKENVEISSGSTHKNFKLT
ncbi:hypothetical protein COB11_02980 [Candidatus Aerophobetes bacterium]|uniref:Leucine-rich repeat domain-containing protein n=1 Tax=Aerophobetes bacterium TaxID=2030807 RepID=A0A2A4YLA3_UNCAE|nr:MAG: hypothetical protein COB11_02980 [Candidatus Aerophobetes bacterium]